MFFTLVLGLLQGLVSLGQAQSRPNIVFIMTDDQDKRLGSTDYQPTLHSELMLKGTQFTNHYTNTALCCPSRSTILRGQTVRKYPKYQPPPLYITACMAELELERARSHL